MADLYIPVQDDVTKIPGSTVSRGWQLFFQKLVQAVGATTGNSAVQTTGPVIVSHADIATLPTTAVEIIAAPDAGSRIRVLNVSYSFDTTAGAYTNIDPTYADLSLLIGPYYAAYGPVDDSTTTPVLDVVTNTLGAVGQTVYDVAVVPFAGAPGPSGALLQYVQNTGAPLRSDIEATALALKMDNNGSGDLMGGDPANTVTVTVYYAIEAL